MKGKKILIELPLDVYQDVVKIAKIEDRSIRGTINMLIKDRLRGRDD